jgi:6-hydroxycyclohex-1-ene-1-carbonyl-CoA dehydrogenase
MSAIQARGYELVAKGQALQACERLLEPGPDDVIVAVAGCGVCHTDVGFAHSGVPTRQPMPLILGHEIAGRVVLTGERATSWEGRDVIVPAVIPCNQCEACRAGKHTVCRRQFMPGNDGDGGFATHVKVPARGLCPVPPSGDAGLPLSSLAVVADAVTTPFEALRRAHVGPGDVVAVVGAGGVGGFGVQIAAAQGAAVAAVDIDPARLELAAAHGADLVLNARDHDVRDLRKAVRDFAKKRSARGDGIKVFECSGTPAGQQTAFALLDSGGWLGVVGYTPEKVELPLSKLMALDATARGNWGCPPDQYPAALDLVLHAKVALEPYVEYHDLDEAPRILEAVAHHELNRRAILVPNGG